jgi:hypothetical protein
LAAFVAAATLCNFKGEEAVADWCPPCNYDNMSTTVLTVEEVLERATALAQSERNLEMMDRLTVLHGYVELARLDPNNGTYRKDVQTALMSLQELVYRAV